MEPLTLLWVSLQSPPYFLKGLIMLEQATAKAPAAPVAKAPVVKDYTNFSSPSKPASTSIRINKVNSELFSDKYEGPYPFGDLEVGQALFIPNKQAQTTDQALVEMHKRIVEARKFYSECEVDENGDEILETVIVKSTKRNQDGSVVLQSDGKPNTGAQTVTRPKLIYSRHFVARPVIKDYDLGGNQTASEDGIVVIRVS